MKRYIGGGFQLQLYRNLGAAPVEYTDLCQASHRDPCGHSAVQRLLQSGQYTRLQGIQRSRIGADSRNFSAPGPIDCYKNILLRLQLRKTAAAKPQSKAFLPAFFSQPENDNEPENTDSICIAQNHPTVLYYTARMIFVRHF